MNTIKLLVSVILVSAIVLFSCPNPEDPSEPTPSPTQEITSPEPTPSPTPEITPEAVTGVKATKLYSTDHIHVTWNPASGADSYRIYRYLHKSTDSIDEEFTSTTNYYDDTTAMIDTPYFYKVVNVIENTSSDLSENYAAGIYSTTIDSFEPNGDSLTAQEVSSAAGNEAIMYSFYMGEAQDTDWYQYVYTGSIELMSIRVEFSAGNPLIGNLMLEINNDHTTWDLTNESNSIDYYTISEDFYFSIYFKQPDTDINVIGTYTIYLDFI